MRFEVANELDLFAASVRGVLAGWVPPSAPIAEWLDERDEVLASRLAELGWAELWSDPALLGPAVAGAIELGRSLAPLDLVDEPTLGAPLAVEGRVRHGAGRSHAALPLSGGGLVLVSYGELEREPALDAIGTLVGLDARDTGVALADASARWHAWSAVTLGYLAGLADASLDATVAYVKTREQFGAPLGELPAVRARLADAAVAAEGLRLVAWASVVANEDGRPMADLAWAGPACREVTASALQAHGAIGFALESGLHRLYRRAKTIQVWADAVLAATADP